METLFADQQTAIDKLRHYKVGALFMEAGTGKTRIAVELSNDIPEVDYLLWIGPYQTIHRTEGVPEEINKWGGFRCQNVDFCGIESLQNSDRIYLELLRKLQNASHPFIIVDESLKIKNADAKRTKRLLELGKLSTYRLILNGTPISRNLLDLWSQMEFLSPKILGMSMAEFKNTFCEYTRVTKRFGSYKAYTKEFITGYENIDYLYSLIRHYVFECDLNLQVQQYYNTINYVLDELSSAEYYQLKEKYLDNETLLWKNNNIFLEMTQKMQHTYSCTAEKFEKLNDLFKTVDESRTIIFCKYIDSQDACRKYFKKATILSYQKESLGLNMQHLHNTIYFDKNWDYALRVQSGRRTFRSGQEYDCRYWDMTGNVGLEKLIDSNINKKVGMAEYFKGKTKEQLKKIL
jgi:SNF2 family DNA or RNA helicase